MCATVTSLRDLSKGGCSSAGVMRRIAAGSSAYARAVVEAGGVVADHHFAECRRMLGLGVAQGDADAQTVLGRIHRDGEGGPVDFAEARRLYGLAAAQGHANAQVVLGIMHHEGAERPG